VLDFRERTKAMPRYLNRGGDSGVVAYETGDNSIEVAFRDGSAYLYDVQSTGGANIQTMKQLAADGQGLNSFISRVVKKGYAAKLR
jgi:hypothetical protein